MVEKHIQITLNQLTFNLNLKKKQFYIKSESFKNKCTAVSK